MGTTITGTGTVGITLRTAAQNPVVVDGTIAATGFYAIEGLATADWSITNFGTLSAGLAAIDLLGVGVIDNTAGGHLSGGGFGIIISKAGGSVSNAGIISGGTLTGVAMSNGGALTNLAHGTITGAVAGVAIGGVATVANAGLIHATGTGAQSYGIAAGSTNGKSIEMITNTGTIIGGIGIALSVVSTGTVHRGAGTVVNAGTIKGTTGVAVRFAPGANRLVDDPGAVFVGKVLGGLGTGTSNTLELASGKSAGTVRGLGTSFVSFGTVTVDAGASWVLSGANSLAAGSLFTDSGTVTNAGTLIDPGTLIDAGRMTNSGRIVGEVTISSGHSLVNSGTIAGGVAVTMPGAATAGVTLVNAGRIAARTAAGVAVQLGTGNDRLVLDPGASFFGSVNGGAGVNVLELAAGKTSGVLTGLGKSIVNFGTVNVDAGATWLLNGANTLTAGTRFTDNGTVTNSGTLTDAGVLLDVGRMTNKGTIVGDVTVSSGHWFDNAGSIAGGVRVAMPGAATAGVTLVSSGRIAASSATGLAVELGSGADRLVLQPGASFVGRVDGGAGANVLDLSSLSVSPASVGTVSGLGTQITNFATVVQDAGANWELTGRNTVATLTDFGQLRIAANGTLDVTTSVAAGSTGTITLDAASVLDVAANGGGADRMQFIGAATLIVEHAAKFGTHVGTTAYSGPLIEGFGAGDRIELKDIIATSGVTLNYNPTSGLLQVIHSNHDVATLHFQGSSLGSGSFHVNHDSAGHILITHS